MAPTLDLDQYQYKRPVLLIFAPDPQDVRYEEQATYLHDDSGAFEESRIAPFGIFENGPSFADDRPVSNEDAQRARERFEIEEGQFGLHLIALDGTEVLRSDEPLPLDQLSGALQGEGG